MGSRISDLQSKGVKYRGGFRGRRIPIQALIRESIRFTVVDFKQEESRMRDCDGYCMMQIEIDGKLYVTWHSSTILTDFLNDVKEDGESNFPIVDCVMYEGDDRGYYLTDGDDSNSHIPSQDTINRIINQNEGRNRRR